MKDFLGNELAVGDIVIFSPKNYKYSLVAGKIVKITPQKVRVTYRLDSYDQEYIMEPCQLIKKPSKKLHAVHTEISGFAREDSSSSIIVSVVDNEELARKIANWSHGRVEEVSLNEIPPGYLRFRQEAFGD